MELPIDPLALPENQISTHHKSPWDVTSIYEFQVFCCPECDTIYEQKQTFVNHAYCNHPKAFKHLSAISDQSLSDIILPWSVDVDIEIKMETPDEYQEDPIITVGSIGFEPYILVCCCSVLIGR
jgi:hypothetical protein